MSPRLELLTAEEVAQILRVKTRTVYDLVRNHELPALRLGDRCLRFRPSAIEAWLDARQQAEAALQQRPALAFHRSR
ncbi:MAG: DNA-binding protein [Deltaproteobacteria bacterium]|nr:MAG: DNA-binding protein [Deltaproteobacteria bacterium]